ncbi:MAG: CHC2 zinc finger domain-containing protein [Anaerolineae bacterium]
MLRPVRKVSEADLAAFRARLVNRDDVYAQQWADGAGWSRVAAPVTDKVLRAHLSGGVTVGFYAPDLDGNTRWVCVDFDTDDGLERGQHLQATLAEDGLPSVVELSAHGRCHLWLFFDTPTPAAPLRRGILAVLESLGWTVEPGVLEVFPKHDSIAPDGYGSLVRAPMGRHRKVGGEIFPVLRRDEATGETLRGGLATLLRAPAADPSYLTALAPAETAAAPIEPLTRRQPLEPGQRSPLTEAIYARTSVRQLMAERGISVGRTGKARCPFHDDRRPSFQDYGSHFYCFGCGARGDVITLYQRFQRLPDRWRAREALAEKLGLDPDEIRSAGRGQSVRRGEPRVIQLSFWRELTRSA